MHGWFMTLHVARCTVHGAQGGRAAAVRKHPAPGVCSPVDNQDIQSPVATAAAEVNVNARAWHVTEPTVDRSAPRERRRRSRKKLVMLVKWL